ncbi:NAD(P)-dependent dehydrogenase (short-subunit alcohol dehydrogenase family) [Actinocorallia herbida]|uniref:NAD(P)-dependent dehydrogenase (Short-subunit alcohol dehydrogenase family) n=1 Tax=Actinocorallia herbida TaxID=58109 RepID=A0A3N1CQD9_9ACTN|nr:SDR family oxidoreductase [Actinocorallia herbida]ROO83530.1 NAD(P)-dependent dehydrogenase (short-subunit alcohol dehydrogenase family) [Actinocorallia herbida]
MSVGTLVHDYTGRVALVTGGTRGLGAGIARAFADAGARVVVCARKAARRAEGADAPGHFLPCDVRDPEDVARLMDDIRAEYGRLDVVVNNAGGGPYAPVAEAPPRLLQRVIELNLLGPLYVAQAAYPLMDEGAIVMVGSVSGTRPSPGTSAYGAAKAGLHHLAACLAAEWAPKVRVNTVVVGLAESGDDQAEHYGGEETLRAIKATVPAGRFATPSDVAAACLYLASAPHVTGASLTLDGGGEQAAWQYLVQNPGS